MRPAVFAALISLCAIPSQATSQEPPTLCGPDVLSKNVVRANQGVTLTATGMTVTGRWVELFTNQRTGAWALLVTLPGAGHTCIVGWGDDFEFVNDTPAKEDR